MYLPMTVGMFLGDKSSPLAATAQHSLQPLHAGPHQPGRVTRR